MTSAPAWTQAAQPGARQPFVLQINGAQVRVTCESDTPLLYVLRNDLGLRATRFGCGLGQCGACMVLLDGVATYSCDLPVWSVVGHEVVTVEGLGDADGPGPLQRAFEAEQAAQCGYCMSGMLIAATGLLQADPAPDQATIRAALDRNLCRCGSHTRVIRAVQRAAAEPVTEAASTR